jgi:hypothetical protein
MNTIAIAQQKKIALLPASFPEIERMLPKKAAPGPTDFVFGKKTA